MKRLLKIPGDKEKENDGIDIELKIGNSICDKYEIADEFDFCRAFNHYPI